MAHGRALRLPGGWQIVRRDRSFGSQLTRDWKLEEVDGLAGHQRSDPRRDGHLRRRPPRPPRAGAWRWPTARSATSAGSTSGSHSGTHIDAPVHFIDGAAGIEHDAARRAASARPWWSTPPRSTARSTERAIERLAIPAGTERLLLPEPKHPSSGTMPGFDRSFVAVTVPTARTALVERRHAPRRRRLPVDRPVRRADRRPTSPCWGPGSSSSRAWTCAAIEPGWYDLICLPVLHPRLRRWRRPGRSSGAAPAVTTDRGDDAGDRGAARRRRARSTRAIVPPALRSTDVPDGRGVLVEVLRVGLCGTDRGDRRGAVRHGSRTGDDFLVIGHESLGRVARRSDPGVPAGLRPRDAGRGNGPPSRFLAPGPDRAGDMSPDRRTSSAASTGCMGSSRRRRTSTITHPPSPSRSSSSRSPSSWSRCRSSRRASARRSRSSAASGSGRQRHQVVVMGAGLDRAPRRARAAAARPGGHGVLQAAGAIP